MFCRPELTMSRLAAKIEAGPPVKPQSLCFVPAGCKNTPVRFLPGKQKGRTHISPETADATLRAELCRQPRNRRLPSRGSELEPVQLQ